MSEKEVEQEEPSLHVPCAGSRPKNAKVQRPAEAFLRRSGTATILQLPFLSLELDWHYHDEELSSVERCLRVLVSLSHAMKSATLVTFVQDSMEKMRLALK